MPRGILETIGLAGSVLFAAPVALYGAGRVADGAVTPGVAFLAVAVLMIVVPRIVTTPDDLLSGTAERAAGRLVVTDDDEEE